MTQLIVIFHRCPSDVDLQFQPCSNPEGVLIKVVARYPAGP